MIPDTLLKKLRCVNVGGGHLKYGPSVNSLQCEHCETIYPSINGIPMIMWNDPSNENWNTWNIDETKMSADSYYKRSNGDLPEKESSKSFAHLLHDSNIYKKGDSLLDYGCASGHFYRSFRDHLDKNVVYTGIDSNMEFLQWGRNIFGISDKCNFVQCDCNHLPFHNNSYDISVVNLFHFFPIIERPLKEAIRVTSKYLVWRTPISDITNYVVHQYLDKSYDKLGNLHFDRKDISYDICNIFTKKYITGLIEDCGGTILYTKRDTDFKSFDNTKIKSFKNIPATKVVNGYQINDRLVLDWTYFVIDCR